LAGESLVVGASEILLGGCGPAPASTFLQERSAQFDAQFFRCHGLLHFIACRVLAGSEGAGEAIENCRVELLGTLQTLSRKALFAIGWLEF
jgi:hypothetical protein